MANQPVTSSTESLEQSPQSAVPAPVSRPPESGGPKGPEPTRYGDWEINGKCVDF